MGIARRNNTAPCGGRARVSGSRTAHIVDKDDQAIDRVSVIERQDDVFDALEALTRADIGRFGLECFAEIHDPAAILPNLAWCLLVLDFRKLGTRIVFEKVFGHISTDQAVFEVQIRLAFYIQENCMRHKSRDLSRIDVRPARQAAIDHLGVPV